MANKKAASKKIVSLPIPLERWFNDAKRIEELRDIMDAEALQTAIAILKEIAGPSNGTISSDPVSNSHSHAWYAGYRDAFNDLYRLTKPKQAPTNPHQEEWTHIQTPQQ